MKRRTFLLAGGAAAASALFATARAAALPSISPALTARDPLASKNAQNVYSHLVALENAARAGTSPMTVMGQHIEGQNELYNPGYGDTGGTTYVGYYYNKVEAITGGSPASSRSTSAPAGTARTAGESSTRAAATTGGACRPPRSSGSTSTMPSTLPSTCGRASRARLTAPTTTTEPRPTSTAAHPSVPRWVTAAPPRASSA